MQCEESSVLGCLSLWLWDIRRLCASGWQEGGFISISGWVFSVSPSLSDLSSLLPAVLCILF